MLIQENWNCADSGNLTCQLPWTEVEGTSWGIVSNRADLAVAAGTSTARADADLETIDHFAQVTIAAITHVPGGAHRGGVICRKDNTATLTYYRWYDDEDDQLCHLGKIVAGIGTELGTANQAIAGDVLRLEVAGSNIRAYRNGILQLSVVDTEIATGRRCGVTGANDTALQVMQLDTFSAGDIVPYTVSPGPNTIFKLRGYRY